MFVILNCHGELPEKLELDPSSADASKHWEQWKKTFENFLGSFTTVPTETQKLAALFNHVSNSIYSCISSSTSYTDAVKILTDIYKPNKEVYSRYCLLSRQQKEGESVDDFMHALDRLSKECDFKSVTAQDYRDEYVRDSFIRGLRSLEIRQQLFEECNDRITAFTKARTLELVVRNSQLAGNTIYNTKSDHSHTDHDIISSLHIRATMTSNSASKSNLKVLPRGSASHKAIHQHGECPAVGATFHSCGLKVHFSNACQSSNSRGNNEQANPNRSSLLPISTSILGTNPVLNTVVSTKVSGSVNIGKRKELKYPKNAAGKEQKRKHSVTSITNGKVQPPNKKQKTEKSNKSTALFLLTEENVWRCLAHKPISTKQIIAKFKRKKLGLDKQEMVLKLSSILKKIAKQFLKDGKNYFVLKDEYKNLYNE